MKKSFLIGSLLLNALLVVLLLTVDRTKGSCHRINFQGESFTSRQENFKTAHTDVKRFYDSIVKQDASQRDFVRAFTISAMDMLEVMGLDSTTKCTYEQCRAYLGLTADDQFKLYLTPIKDNKDVFLNFKPATGATIDTNEYSYVLDLIAPCPNTCDKKSPLYNFSKPEASR
ncbi:hypothetical protein H9Y05_09825 [Crocinitomicaceae bacterium CZZ-1]|uniref:Uncharacterized protein n=1 Tax=Taishania pollutisoli TaxID=2766479 RepID=A0A8J6P6F3_9FLAO|nr:hypothetical protein [Taishania pollutisoli]MBC9812769.1 hypothetical protein [Taishania pollutisoli]